MDSRKYSERFNRSAPDLRKFDTEYGGLLKEADAWSAAFGAALHDIMSGAQPAVDIEQAKNWAHKYEQWTHGPLFDMAVTLFNEGSVASINAVSRLNFHFLNGPMIQMWLPLLSGNKKVPRHFTEISQVDLAMHAMDISQIRDQMIENNVYFPNGDHSGLKDRDDDDLTEVSKRLKAHLEGLMNEFDTAITCMDIANQYPNITVVPSPAQFERQTGKNSSRNADFIVFDLLKRQVRGVEAKLSIDSSSHSYDPNFVTMIDGRGDLYSQLAVRTDPKRSCQSVVGWPGLIAAHFLVERSARRAKNPLDKRASPQHRMLYQTKINTATQRAREIVRQTGTRSMNKQASSAVTKRVLHDLYADDPGEKAVS